MKSLGTFVFASTFLGLAITAHAEFPERNFKLIVPYAAGGGTDTMARTLAPELEKALGKTVIVVNRPGAQGQIGTAEIANAKPDGYTLGLLATSDFLLTQALDPDPGFTMESFDFLATFNISANAIVFNKDVPFDTYDGFVAYAQENPGALTFGVSGDTHIYELIRQENQKDIDVNFIRFAGGGESRNALLGGHVDGLMIDKSFVGTLSESGAKALAVASGKRFDSIPDVPTFEESGVDLDNASRRALVLPAGVPEDRVKAIMAAVDSFAGGEDFKAKLEKINEVQDYMSGDDVVTALNAQLDAINAVVEANPEAFSK